MNSQTMQATPLKKNAALCDRRRETLFNMKPDRIKAGISTALVKMKLEYLLPTNSTEFIERP